MASENKKIKAISAKLWMIFIIVGAALLATSIIAELQIIALIGLGILFWGALFLFLNPARHVDAHLLYSTSLASYSTVDRIIADFDYKGKGYHIPSYPKDVYLPEHLKGLKDVLVFISSQETREMPPVEELAESKFLLKDSKGVLIAPPGLGLLDEMESKLHVDLTKTGLAELCEMLPPFLLDNFEIAKDLTLNVKGNSVNLRLTNSIFKNLYGAAKHSKSVSILGCPLASAVACALAKSSGKPVVIQRYRISLDGMTVEVQFNIAEGGSE
ncbi:MAG: hypothetical protein ACFCUE_05395 [Candidatus Bathyarchaeia archaeon]